LNRQSPSAATGDPLAAALRLEARRFGAYLLGVEPPDATVDLYVQAVEILGLVGSDKDRRLLQFMARHPWCIGLVDAGLALRRPDSTVRARLLVLSALLEARPELADRFLPAPQRAVYVGYAAIVGLRAVIKAAGGLVLVGWI
jgi:hypothetical protein